MDYIGGMLNHFGEMPKTQYKNTFCNGFTGKKLMVYNGILMETIGISVMVSIGLLLFFFAGYFSDTYSKEYSFLFPKGVHTFRA